MKKLTTKERLDAIERDIAWLKTVVDSPENNGSLIEHEVLVLKETSRWIERAVWWLITSFVVSFVIGVGLVVLRSGTK